MGTDLFYHKNACYLLIVDYYSRYTGTVKLLNKLSTEVISYTKAIFARDGIPQEVVSDNGPQFSSIQYNKFATEYGFLHTTSSPWFPQSNGGVRGQLKLKNLLKKAEDHYMAMLTYLSTPLSSGFSLAELLINCYLRANLPIVQSQLQPPALLKAKEEEKKKNQKRVFNSWHAVQDLDPIFPRDGVWIVITHYRTCCWTDCTQIISCINSYWDTQTQSCASAMYANSGQRNY